MHKFQEALKAATGERTTGRTASRPMLPRTTFWCAETDECCSAVARPPTLGASPRGPGANPTADHKDHLPTAMDEHYRAGGRTASAPLSETLHPLSKQAREARSPSLRPPPGERNLDSDEHEDQQMKTVGAWLDLHAATARRRAPSRAYIREWMPAEAAQVTACLCVL